MKKIYRYNELRNTVKIDITAPGGMTGTLLFDNGNVATREYPTVIVGSKFWQIVIDDTLVKSGRAKCIQIIVEDSDKEENIEMLRQKREKKESHKAIEEIESLEQAMDYLANNYGVAVKTIGEARTKAAERNISFPNLKSNR